MRLDKYLCSAGLGTRSQVKELIRKGRITVNGTVGKRPELQIDPQRDEVALDKTQVVFHEYVYYMLYKPTGYVSATQDQRYPTVMELLPEEIRRRDLFPVGRLDLDTEGLLLITNDGALAHRLLSPSHHVPKTYYARIQGSVGAEEEARFADGVEIGEKHPTRPAVLQILSQGDVSEIELTITEGKYHQVKRMFEAVGKKVLYLKRLCMGTLTLDPALEPGSFRLLTDLELCRLKDGI
ncbi:MAG: rRNA pseudouridine synthase [Lachnospiraceae bacterium]|nr:rRNA pseudouridine synthase [Lachnospiraceae bacterium]